MSDAKEAKKLSRIGSEVKASDASGQIFKGLQVWCDCAPGVKQDPSLMFAKCLVLPGSTAQTFKLKQVEPEDPENRAFDAPQSSVYNTNQNIDPLSFPDIGMIPHTNVAAVVDFIRTRFLKKQIYTTADPLLLAINPFKDLGNATDEVIKKYRDTGDAAKLPPHVFSVAREALENLHGINKSQTIIVSGESGAGKTEATKQIMRYFAAAKSGKIDLKVQKAVLAGNPVLEAFGNAKTIRNNNSSRFGRFMQLAVAPGGGIEFGSVRNFLLEVSRVVTQDDQERSYHIFYQLLKGLTGDQKSKFKILGPTQYKFVNAKCLDVPGWDDVQDWKEVNESLHSMGATEEDINGIIRCVSAIMMLGNVTIKGENKNGVPDAATIANPAEFQTVCDLLGISAQDATIALVTKITQAQGQEIKGVYNAADTEILKLSMAKAVYNELFNWIIRKLNSNIEPPSGFDKFLGMLDIFGFEVFQNNSLEQLFINITNEMLQKDFVDVVFDKEQKLYRSEGINTADLVWTTNAPIIDCLTNKKSSVISYLEDTCLAPGGDDKKFLAGAAGALSSNKHFAKAKISSDINFIITHTIGDIQYNSTGFIAKNKDMLKAELVEVMQKSSSHVTAALFKDVTITKGKIGKSQLISSVFLGQLTKLMELIRSTEPHFIRCLKPNEEKQALKFTSAKVLIQLHALSILEALQLRNLGYSYRRPFEDFIKQFKFLDLGITENKSLDPKTAATQLLEGSGLKPQEFQIGHTMIFLKHEATKALTQRQRELMAAWEPLTALLEAMYKAYSTRQLIKTLTPSIVRVQAHIRANLVRK
ncbi:putative myosin [Gregarina niphandrodes]|uniref:Myosin n=1 Tax=Gregarina niphandrodes TaxID=110365 RepID=A0A023B1H7_GRENI|nr:putative myosin [Gregarina niphandrodes]EZG47683.1 putative myosin [Gregarina niphandrodes]|eukprot:XP_011132149.1 putative myosin [Gregarina niphandrodes]